MSQHSQFGHHHHHHPHSHPAVLHNASLADIASQPTSSHPYGSNVGSAVASSMHLTNSTSETDAGNATYKMEHDMMNLSYYAVRFLKHFVFAVALLTFYFSQAATKLIWIEPHQRWILELGILRRGFVAGKYWSGGQWRWESWELEEIFVVIWCREI